MDSIKIAVASGKGGTGKTTIATSLAAALARSGFAPPLFLDCDVEAPNAHLFLNPDFSKQKTVSMLIPEINLKTCTFCGLCAQTCQFHALAVVGKNVLVFPQLCHACGACSLVCPVGAITEKPHPIGMLECGTAVEDINFVHGLLQIGEPMAKPIIEQLKSWVQPDPGQIVMLDAPPGTTCSVVETIRDADFLLLVTEPTPFGLHDLKLMLELANMLSIPHGVILNRYGIPHTAIEEHCAKNNIPVLLTIPFERRIAEGISQGKLLIDILPEYQEKLCDLYLTKIVNQIKLSNTTSEVNANAHND